MVKGPETLSSPDAVTVGTDRFAALFSYPRQLKQTLRDIAVVGELVIGPAAFVDTVVTGIRSLDVGVTATTALSDAGVVYSISNFLQKDWEERSKPLAVVTGILGMTGSVLSKTGNPDLMLPAAALGGISLFLAHVDASK